MKTVSDDFIAEQAKNHSLLCRRISYKRRTWDSGTSAYIWDAAWTVIPESQIVSVGAITAKLDTDALNEFKVSNLDLTVLNSDGTWSPWGAGTGDVFDGAEPFWTKFKIESGWTTRTTTYENRTDGVSGGMFGNTFFPEAYFPDPYFPNDDAHFVGAIPTNFSTASEYLPMFVGVAVGFTAEAGKGVVRFNVQGLEAILMNANAEDVSTTVSDETPSGTVNGSNKDFTTLNPGVGIIDEVAIDGTAKKVGTDYDIAQLNEPTLGAKITFTTAPTTGQAVKVDYRYWGQDQNIEDLVDALLTEANLESGASIHAVTFPGGVGDSFIVNSLTDWSAGTTTDGDYSRVSGELRIKLDVSSNYTLLDNFSDGNYSSDPTWTVEGRGLSCSAAGNDLYVHNTSSEGVISTPSNGARVGMWKYKFKVHAMNWAEPVDFNFVGNSKVNNSISPFGPQYISGDWVSFWSLNVSPGTDYLQLWLNGTQVAQVDAGGFMSYDTYYTIKIIAAPTGQVYVYVDGTLRLSGTRSTVPTSNLIGISTGRNGYFGDSESYFDNIYTPATSFSATWTSPSYDMTASVVAFGTMVIDKHVGDGAITISTRTSADNSTWEDWEAVSADGTVNSTVERYIQVKVVMTMDSADTDEPYVSYIKLNYNKLTTVVKLANFTGKTVYDAIQALGAFANYEWGFKEDETFFFREKPVSVAVDLALAYNTNLLSLETVNAGHDRVYSEVQARFGNYDVVAGDTTGLATGPLKRFGKKRYTVENSDILIGPDTDVATGIASGLYDTLKDLRRMFKAKIKLAQWLDLSDTVSLDWGTEFSGTLAKVLGVRHDLKAAQTELDLEEVLVEA